MKKKIELFFIFFILISLFIPITSYADMGPKPSVTITFENMDDTPCYATLLSKEKSDGIHSAWDGDENNILTHGLDIEIWLAFAEYQDKDGYYFLQEAEKIGYSKEYTWIYPPETFKILLYYPENATFIVSQPYENYAFSSYFTVDMNNIHNGIIATKSYDFTLEAILFALRVITTIMIEYGIALAFGLTGKKLILPVIAINFITQIGLNIALNISCYQNGPLGAIILTYLPAEFLIFIVETLFYFIYFRLINKQNISTLKLTLYSLVANLITFLVGCCANFFMFFI